MECTQEIFLEDVKNHVMHIVAKQGVNRHIRFRKVGMGHMWFDVITWSDHLCITGDMGTYVFCRIPDMFEFFRRDAELPDSLYINLQYWSEKCIAIDHHNGVEVYSPEKFEKRIKERMDEEGVSESVRLEVEDTVLFHANDGEYAAMQAALEFEHEDFQFYDFWEVNLKEFSYHFVWCCYAIAWAIQQYDKLNSLRVSG
uniref:Uncharacterized protein n=1 Tax=viral metagenome TaxID=1070528 RepID=A0A6M3XGZ5_9ZZZZ